MASMSGEELLRRYVAASAEDDLDTMEAPRHPDWNELWPQSGEVIRSSANYRTVRLQRPEGAPRVVPGRLGGSGDCWWGEAVVHYADGSRWLGDLDLRAARRARVPRAGLLRPALPRPGMACPMG